MKNIISRDIQILWKKCLMQSKEYIIAQVNEILENHTVYMNLPQ